MGLKILHSADWHLDSPFAGFDDSQRALLRQEQLSIPGKTAQLCRREKCDLLLLAGDIFDGEPARETVEVLKKALSECGARVFITPGNHDFCAPGSLWLEERWPENVYVFTRGLEAVTIPELNCRVYGAGYQSMDSAPLLESFRAGSEVGIFISKQLIGNLAGEQHPQIRMLVNVLGAAISGAGTYP